MDGLSKNLTQEYIKQLQAIFPETVTEVADQDGNNISLKVDMEKLSILLGEASIPEDDVDYKQKYGEKFSFEWAGKRRAIAEAQKRSTGTLRPCPEESEDWDNTENLYIEGDNLEVLKLLQDCYLGAIKMIYIDPPYNTGKDFVYKDNYRDNLSNYLEQINTTNAVNSEVSGRYHTNWLNMMYPRLKLARNLLTDDGVIFISIDDHEVANLKTICNEIFGEDNYIGVVVWKNATDNNPTQIAIEHEYIICYSRDKDKVTSVWKSHISDVKNLLVNIGNQLCSKYEDNKQLEEAYKKWYKIHKAQLWPLDRYKYIDKGGIYTGSQSVHNPGREGYRYDIIHPITGKPCVQPLLGYRYPESTMNEMIQKGNILFGEDHNKIIEIKLYAKDYEEKLSSVFELDGRIGSYDLKAYFGKNPIFNNPKPVFLVQRFLSFLTKGNDIILDFFSGSSTTSEAVLRLNKTDLDNRKYICVQFPENLDLSILNADLKTKSIIKNAIQFLDSIKRPHLLTELGKERIRRAGKKILEEQKDKEQRDLFTESTKKLDIGFKVFKLDQSNVADWDVELKTTNEKDAKETLTLEFNKVLNILKDGRTELDLLYEVMLKLGLQLTTKVEEKEINGKKFFIVGHGVMVASFSKDITYSDITKMLEYKPDYVQPGEFKVVLSDESFASNNDKVNAMQLFKQKGITNFEII